MGVVNAPNSSVQPIIQTLFTTDANTSLPTTISETLTWDGVTQSAVNFSTSGDQPGDTLALGVQVDTPVTSTGNYSWQTVTTATYPDGSQATGMASGTTAVAVSGSGGS